MPSFIEERPQTSGKIGYAYSIAGEDVVAIATDVIMMADAPFVFQGKVGDERHALQQPAFIPTPLQKGGMVAATVPYNGSSVNVYFTSQDEMLVVPTDGAKSTADTLIGADIDGYALEAGDYDEDGYDPFDGEYSDMDEFDDGMGAMPDPRARAADLMERYGNSEALVPIPDDQGASGMPGAAGAYSGEVVTKGEWFVTLLLLAIPIVNIVVLILWLVSKKTKESKRNYLVMQVLMWVISLLVTLGIAVLLVLSGAYLTIGGALGVYDTTPSSPSASGTYYYGDEDGSDDEGADDGEDADEEDMNANSNLNANANSNSTSGGNTSSELTGGMINDAEATSVVIDSITREAGPDNKTCAVVTMTMHNGTSRDASPAELLDVTAKQGQNDLVPNFLSFANFSPEMFDASVVPGGSITFQVCYFLVDDQAIVVHVAEKGTGTVYDHKSSDEF